METDQDLLAKQLVLLHGDGWKGCPDCLFDCIHVGAAAETIPALRSLSAIDDLPLLITSQVKMPRQELWGRLAPLLEQLKPGGRMVIPVGKQSQHLYQIDKTLNGEYEHKQLMGVRYVPLVKSEVAAAGFGIPQRTAAECSLEEPTPNTSPQSGRTPAALKLAVYHESSQAPERAGCIDSEAETAVAGIGPPIEIVIPSIAVKATDGIEPSDAKCCWCSTLGC
jgi:hypothetical protein